MNKTFDVEFTYLPTKIYNVNVYHKNKNYFITSGKSYKELAYNMAIDLLKVHIELQEIKKLVDVLKNG